MSRRVRRTLFEPFPQEFVERQPGEPVFRCPFLISIPMLDSFRQACRSLTYFEFVGRQATDWLASIGEFQ